jgi:hypothetical protein
MAVRTATRAPRGLLTSPLTRIDADPIVGRQNFSLEDLCAGTRSVRLGLPNRPSYAGGFFGQTYALETGAPAPKWV